MGKRKSNCRHQESHRMNQHTALEHAAALELQAHAALLVTAYAKPEDAAASRLAVLMIATQQEARAQGITAPLVFSHEVQE
jgi:hypothetical protein